MALVTVKMEDFVLLDMLLDRVKHWTKDQDVVDLYRQMYEHLIDTGYLEGSIINIAGIVDNDIINYCDTITVGDNPNDFKKLLELYHQGEYNVSCEEFEEVSASFIEAVSDDEQMILIRY